MSKLSARLTELQAVAERAEVQAPYRLTTGSFAALAAALALIAYVTLEVMNRFTAPQALTLPPVVATAPAAPAPVFSPRAYMAAMSTGISVWPAVLMADEAPRHLADVELQQASLR